VQDSLTANQKGAIAELAIQLAATRAKVGVYLPTDGHSRADLVLEVGGRLLRVQAKWGQLSPDRRVIRVSTSGSRCTPQGYIRSPYAASEVDLLGVYCGELDRCFLVPVELFAGRHAIHLRLDPARNNQEACINLAERFAFDGAIAQLGERRHGMAEVVGSSPTSSTAAEGLEPTLVGSNPFRDRLGHWLERVAGGEEVVVTFRGRPRVRLSPITPELPLAA
jgi:hypothetical protein